jgi:hypothetical protein
MLRGKGADAQEPDAQSRPTGIKPVQQVAPVHKGSFRRVPDAQTDTISHRPWEGRFSIRMYERPADSPKKYGTGSAARQPIPAGGAEITRLLGRAARIGETSTVADDCAVEVDHGHGGGGAGHAGAGAATTTGRGGQYARRFMQPANGRIISATRAATRMRLLNIGAPHV